jgi:hypothetical protein
MKLCHQHLPLGKMLHHRDGRYPVTCPGCQAEVESHDHFLSCNAPLRIKWHLTLILAVGQQLDMTQTNKDLKFTIINALDHALAGHPILVNGPFSIALHAQELIGWRAMLQGYWA